VSSPTSAAATRRCGARCACNERRPGQRKGDDDDEARAELFRNQRHGRRARDRLLAVDVAQPWHGVTGDRAYLRRAARVIDLFRCHFFDQESWTLGEHFDVDWLPLPGDKGQWTEPGHHFEWASLLVDFARASGQKDLVAYARKLYSSAVASGLNRATGLAYAAVSRQGLPLDRLSRSWPQCEAVKAAVALDGIGGPDLKPEIEARVARLFRWHIDPAPLGLWVDRIDERGRSLATEVPASIFYHLVTALMQYLDKTGGQVEPFPLSALDIGKTIPKQGYG